MKITYEIDTNDQKQAIERKQIEKASDMAKVLWSMSFTAHNTVQTHLEKLVNAGHQITLQEAIDMVFVRYDQLLELYGINVEEINKT